MNRMEEYQAMINELDLPAPALETTLDRAYKKRRKRSKFITRPVAALASCFIIFVLLVNFCAPVAYACSQVPILRELAEAVTFSRSLTDAVENEYVQPISLTETENGITASVEYLIVDQKQVNVFYRLNSDLYTEMAADPTVLQANGEYAHCSYGNNNFGTPNGELQSLTIDFVDEDVPSSLLLRLNIRDNGTGTMQEVALENSGDYLLDEHTDETGYIAQMEFLLEFDPKFTAAGKVYPVNQTVILDGQEITITDVSVYPTHLRVNIEDSPDNTAWLKMLYFYIETDWGMKFDRISSGTVATGSTESPTMNSYRADSTYFYQADHLKIVITGAEWLDKDMERVYVNLKTGETGPLPEGVELYSTIKEGNSWIVEMKAEHREEDHFHQILSWNYYDAEGSEYSFDAMSSIFGEPNEEGETTYFIERVPLKNYPYEEVWFGLEYTHEWVAEDRLVITVQ